MTLPLNRTDFDVERFAFEIMPDFYYVPREPGY